MCAEVITPFQKLWEKYLPVSGASVAPNITPQMSKSKPKSDILTRKVTFSHFRGQKVTL